MPGRARGVEKGVDMKGAREPKPREVEGRAQAPKREEELRVPREYLSTESAQHAQLFLLAAKAGL